MWLVLNLAALASNATLLIDSVMRNSLLDNYTNCSCNFEYYYISSQMGFRIKKPGWFICNPFSCFFICSFRLQRLKNIILTQTLGLFPCRRFDLNALCVCVIKSDGFKWSWYSDAFLILSTYFRNAVLVTYSHSFSASTWWGSGQPLIKDDIMPNLAYSGSMMSRGVSW